jgi:hypothetical protein
MSSKNRSGRSRKKAVCVHERKHGDLLLKIVDDQGVYRVELLEESGKCCSTTVFYSLQRAMRESKTICEGELLRRRVDGALYNL